MGGFNETPVKLKPLGTPPEAKRDLSMATNSLDVEYMRDILIQRGALDLDAIPRLEREAKARGAKAQVPGYKFAVPAVGHPWLLNAEECHLLRDALLGASGDDIIAAGIPCSHPASWVASCRAWALFLDDCAATGGVSIHRLPERIESW
jgi:hypothetical protein